MIVEYRENMVGIPKGSGQIKDYAEFRKRYDKSQSEVMCILDENSKEILLEVQLIWGQNNHASGWRKLVELLKGRAHGTLEIYDGPVFHGNSNREELTCFFFEQIERRRKEKKVHSVMIQNTTIELNDFDNDRVREILKKYRVVRWATYLVDLTKSEDELFKSFTSAARKNIRRCEKNEVIVKEITDRREYVDLFVANCMKFKNVSSDEWMNEELLAYDCNWSGVAHYYVAMKDGEVLATLGIEYVGGVAREIKSATNPKCYVEKLPAQDYLHWIIMMDAKQRGCEIYDLAGVNPHPKTQKEQGIRRYKEKFNGKYIEYNDLFLEPLIFYLIKKVYFARKNRN